MNSEQLMFNLAMMMSNRHTGIMGPVRFSDLLGEGASALFLLLLATVLLAPEALGSSLFMVLSLITP